MNSDTKTMVDDINAVELTPHAKTVKLIRDNLPNWRISCMWAENEPRRMRESAKAPD